MVTKTENDAAKTWTYQRPPWMLGAALFISSVFWLGAQIAMTSVLIPAKFGVLSPGGKVGLVASLSAVGAIVSLIATIVFGAISDLTRSRFGQRVPWMIFGSIGCSGMMLLIMIADNPALIIIEWALFQIFLAAIVAPIVAVIPDRVPESRRGVFSSVYGSSMMVGGAIGSILASRFITNPDQGILVFSIMILACGPLFALLAPDASNKDVPRLPFTAKSLLHNFSFPTKNARDFYIALMSKLFYVVGSFMISSYQLYILTDYMHASQKEAGDVIAIVSSIGLVLGLIVAAVAGPISDRVGKRKIFIVAAAALMAVGTVLPLAVPQIWTIYVFYIANSIGGGLFNSVDQAINYDVLPDPSTAAKDLGIINMANTGGQVLGPLAGSAIVMLTGGFGAIFVVSIVSMLASGILIKFVKKSK
ncbi:MAG: MFS transporter [Bifidobacteriaceae bacterium]|jgi:MFS family permease|nr:MFS transporter [Bifidobacteriaceae bacterium]